MTVKFSLKFVFVLFTKQDLLNGRIFHLFPHVNQKQNQNILSFTDDIKKQKKALVIVDLQKLIVQNAILQLTARG